jgi:hypothetical protein
MVSYAGIFATAEKARAAREQLSANGFREADLLLLTGRAELQSALSTPDGPSFLSGVESRTADALEAGHVVLSAKAPIGRGEIALSTLEDAGAEKILEADVKKTDHPLSEAFGLPMLTGRRNVQTAGVGVRDGHVTGGLLTKRDKHITGGLITKRHITGGLTTDRHITGGLVTKDQAHFTGFIPLVVGTRKKK